MSSRDRPFFVIDGNDDRYRAGDWNWGAKDLMGCSIVKNSVGLNNYPDLWLNIQPHNQADRQ